MLFSFFTSLIESYSFLNVFKYLTFRTGLSVITSLVVVFLIGGPLIKILLRSAQSNVLVNIPMIIIKPPIVGVPDFLIIWSIGPSCLIGPEIWFLEKILINGPPIIKTTISDVITDNPVLKVRYLKTFKNE